MPPENTKTESRKLMERIQEIVDMDRIQYTVEHVPGVEVWMSRLRPDQRVGWGDGKTYHKLYTPVSSPEKTA